MRTRSRSIALPVALGLLSFGIHVFVNAVGGYGYFRDELSPGMQSTSPPDTSTNHPSRSSYASPGPSWAILFSQSLRPCDRPGLSVAILGLLVRRLSGGRTAMVITSLLFICSAQILGFRHCLDEQPRHPVLDPGGTSLSSSTNAPLPEDGCPRPGLGLGLLNKTSVFGWCGIGVASC